MNIEQLLTLRKNRHHFNQLCNTRSIVPYIGAGMSSNIYPLWRDFLESFDLIKSERAKLKRLLDKGKYEEAASFLFSKSESTFIDTVKSVFSPTLIDSSKFSRSLTLLPNISSDLIITTNLDEIIENVWKHNNRIIDVIITPDNEDQFNDAINAKYCTLVKLHGSVRESSKYVLTKEQYDRCYGTDSMNNIDFSLPFPRDLGRLLYSRTILFLGCSLLNDRVLHILKNIAKWNKYTQHFALLAMDKDEEKNTLRERELARYCIFPIWFPAEDYNSISIYLENLLTKRTEPDTSQHEDSKKVPDQIDIPNTLPRTIPYLVGRDDEINCIKDLIADNKSKKAPTIIISSFDGMPAVGKTALAVRIAHIMTQEYPDAQLYIDCYGYTAGQTPLTSEQIIDSLLFSLGIPANNIPRSFIDKLNLWRTKLVNKKMIVVFDNVKNRSQIDVLIPSSPGSLILITSRNRLTGLDGLYPMQVNVLSTSAAIELLQKVSGKDEQEYREILAMIAKQYDYLPLALQIIASRIRGRSRKYIERLVNAKKPLDSLKTSDAAVYDSFNVSYTLLTEEEKKLIQIMGITPGINFTPNSCAAMIGINIEDIYTMVESLYNQRLVDEVGDDRYKLHDLLRDFAREKYNEQYTNIDEDNSIIRLIDYYIVCIKHCNNLLYPGQFKIDIDVQYPWSIGELPKSREEAFSWLKDELENILACLKIATNRNWMSRYWDLSHVLSHYIRRSVSSWRVMEIHKTAYDYSMNIQDKIKMAASSTELALALHQAGDFIQAVKTFIAAEEYWTLLKHDEGLSYALSNHGFALERLGEYESALNILDKALDIYKKIGKKYGTAFTLNSMGAVHWRLEEYEIAKGIFEEAKKIRMELNDFLGLGSTINNLAFTYLRLGNEEKAREGFEDSLRISREYSDFYGQAVTLNNFGYTEICAKNFRKAISYAWEAYNIALKVSDEYQIGRSCDVKGKAYYGLQEFDNARNSLMEALNIFERLNVPEANEVKDIIQKL